MLPSRSLKCSFLFHDGIRVPVHRIPSCVDGDRVELLDLSGNQFGCANKLSM